MDSLAVVYYKNLGIEQKHVAVTTSKTIAQIK